MSQLNNELLAHVAALKKEKLIWPSVSGNDTTASNVVEMPLPLAQRRLVHSFVITRAFVKVKFNTGENLFRNCPTLLTALYKHVGIEKNRKSMVLTARRYLREKLTRKDTTSSCGGYEIKSTYIRSEKRVLLH